MRLKVALYAHPPLPIFLVPREFTVEKKKFFLHHLRLYSTTHLFRRAGDILMARSNWTFDIHLVTAAKDKKTTKEAIEGT